MTVPRRLSIVGENEQLRGIGPIQFERLIVQSSPGSRTHRGLIHVFATLTPAVIRNCVPPSAQSELLAGTFGARRWVTSQTSNQEIQKLRARAFGAVPAVEDLTERAVQTALSQVEPRKSTPLDAHADGVTLRYAKLGAHFATSAVCHLLDAITKPSKLLEVYSDLQGARAYQLTGLGAARHAAFRRAAWDQAEWEANRHRGEQRDVAPPALIGPLAVQIFHEYLGGRYRAQAEGAQAAMDAFITWALRGQT